MQIEFQLTFEDYRAAWKASASPLWSKRRVNGWAIFLFMSLAIWIFAITCLGNDDMRGKVMPWTPLFVAVYGLLAFGIRRFEIMRQLRRTADRQSSQRWEFTDSGVRADLGHSRSELDWPAFHRFLDGPAVFLLYISEYSYLVVPKRAFADAPQVQEFAEILRQHIQPHTQAFPVITPAEAGKAQ